MSWSKSNYEDENPFADQNENENRLYEAKVPLTANQFNMAEKPLWLQQESTPPPTAAPLFSSSSSQRTTKVGDDISSNTSSNRTPAPGVPAEIDA